MYLFALTLFVEQREKNAFIAYAVNEGPDQTAHARSLIRAFVARCENHWIVQNISAKRGCPDETGRICS